VCILAASLPLVPFSASWTSKYLVVRDDPLVCTPNRSSFPEFPLRRSISVIAFAGTESLDPKSLSCQVPFAVASVISENFWVYSPGGVLQYPTT
jgi:hypothetical protein